MPEPNAMNSPYDLTDPDQRHQAAAEYVLNTLPPRDKASFEALLAFSPDLQAEVQQWREHLQVLDQSLTPVSPPAGLWKKIEQQISPRNRFFGLRFWQMSALVSFSFALALASVLLLKPPMLNANMADHLYVVKSPQQQPAWLVNASMDRSHLMVQTIKPAQVPEGMVCKLWLQVGDDYIPIGTLPHSGLSRMPVPAHLKAELIRARVVISLEAKNQNASPATMGPVMDQGDFMPLEGSLRRF